MKRWLYNKVLKRFFWQWMRFDLVRIVHAVHMDGQTVGERNRMVDGFTADQAVRKYVEQLRDDAPVQLSVEVTTLETDELMAFNQMMESRGAIMKSLESQGMLLNSIAQELAEYKEAAAHWKKMYDDSRLAKSHGPLNL